LDGYMIVNHGVELPELLGTDSCLSAGNMLTMKEYDNVRISFNNGRRKAPYL